VHVSGPADLIGRVVGVEISGAGPNSLAGRLAAPAPVQVRRAAAAERAFA
jgi:hypothetical protein